MNGQVFAGLTAKHCEAAWGIVRESFTKAHQVGFLNRLAGVVVVLWPEGVDGPPWTPANCWGFRDLTGEEITKILFVGQVDEAAPLDLRYAHFAAKKALLAARTGIPSGNVRTIAPWLMMPGDIKWRGGVVENGLAVGFSGVQEVYDEAVAWTMVSWLQAMLRDEMKRLMAGDESFVPDPAS
jgi:hypothetical protein